MDEVKDKFRGLFAKASNAAKLGSSKKFQGQGNRLGTAEVCKPARNEKLLEHYATATCTSSSSNCQRIVSPHATSYCSGTADTRVLVSRKLAGTSPYLKSNPNTSISIALLLPCTCPEQEHGIKPKVQGQAAVAHSAAAAASSSRANGASRASSSQQQQQQQRPPAPLAAPASAQLQPATEFSPFTAVIGAPSSLERLQCHLQATCLLNCRCLTQCRS
jgi:hypothetical protein